MCVRGVVGQGSDSHYSTEEAGCLGREKRSPAWVGGKVVVWCFLEQLVLSSHGSSTLGCTMLPPVCPLLLGQGAEQCPRPGSSHTEYRAASGWPLQMLCRAEKMGPPWAVGQQPVSWEGHWLGMHRVAVLFDA